MRAASRTRNQWLPSVLRRWLPPGLSVVAGALVMGLPLPADLPLMPSLALLGVVVWAQASPALMPPLLAFGLGLTTDLLLGLPIGTEALLFTAIALGFSALARWTTGHGLGVDTAVAAAVIAVHQFAEAALATGGPWWPLLVQGITTTVAYPLAAAGVARWFAQRQA